MKRKKLTKKMADLQWEVVMWAQCPWDTFLEQVEYEGWSYGRLESAAEECESVRDFHKLLGTFV